MIPAPRGAEKNKKLLIRLIIIGVCAAVFLLTALLAYLVPPQKLLIATKLPALQEGELRIHFLSVGQGDCTIVQYPSGNALIVDTGNENQSNHNKLVRYVKGIRAKSLSVLITHADSDHYGGLETLLKVFKADKLYLPKTGSETARAKFETLAKKNKCETLYPSRYNTVTDESGAYGVFLSPYSIGETDENDSSAVLFLAYQGVYTLLCADISAAREKRLVNEYKTDSGIFQSGTFEVPLDKTNILKVSHHGSKSATSREWVELLQPEVSIVTCGQGNLYSHPAEETLSNLTDSEIYRTDELGDIVVSILNGEYSVSHSEG